MTVFSGKRMWIALYIALGLAATLAIGVALVLWFQVEDWSRDLRTNVAATSDDSADERLRPLRAPLGATEFADRVEFAAGKLKGWTLESRNVEGEVVRLHLVRTTPLLRFKDDIRVTIEPQPGGGSVLQAESRSRVGKGDLGQNPRNLRDLLAAVATATQNP
jgi:uncharacterized protein (DUF1499 family)